jgi:hypothetical protein
MKFKLKDLIDVPLLQDLLEKLLEREEKFAKVFRDAPVLISITDIKIGISEIESGQTDINFIKTNVKMQRLYRK